MTTMYRFGFIRRLLFATYLLISTVWTMAMPRAIEPRATGEMRLIQYVQTFAEPQDMSKQLSLLPLMEKSLSVTHVILAALHVNDGPDVITLNDLMPAATFYQSMWSDVRVLQQSGIRVLVMVGGAARGSYAGRLCQKGGKGINHDYYTPLVAFLHEYQLDGIDLDIEEPVLLSCATSLVQNLRIDMDPNFIITMAPVASDLTPTMRGLSGFNYRELEQSSAGALIDWYNTQYYSGFVEGSIEQSYNAAISNGFQASRIVVGVLDSADDGFGFLSIDELQGAISNIRQSNTGFSGVDGWEYYNAGNSDGFRRPIRWLKEIAKMILPQAAAGPATKADHMPPLSHALLQLMADGYSQVDAAIKLRQTSDPRN